MTKIALNACYGGFWLSEAALRRYAEIKGVELLVEDSGDWGHTNRYYYVEDGRKNYVSPHDFDDRSDPVLVRVIEELGDKANGLGADLVIADVQRGTRYRIQEYDGREWIETEDDIEWRVA